MGCIGIELAKGQSKTVTAIREDGDTKEIRARLGISKETHKFLGVQTRLIDGVPHRYRVYVAL